MHVPVLQSAWVAQPRTCEPVHDVAQTELVSLRIVRYGHDVLSAIALKQQT